MSLVSIIIPTYNRRESLCRLLEALGGQAGVPADTEVILADDGSTDGTIAAVEGLRLPFAVRTVRRSRGGPGAARNAGAAEATGRYLGFLEDDVLPAADWLAAARRHLEGGEWDVLEGSTRDASTGKPIRRFEPVPQLSFIPCNLFVCRRLFLEEGGYDPAFFDPSSGLYFREDTELGFRLLAAGARVTVAPDVVVEHPHQFSDLASCRRHVRRYYFDPLLYRKHPRFYRRMIEVKTVAGLRIHRPLHYGSLLFLLSVPTGLAALAGGAYIPAAAAGAVAVLSALAVRAKYMGFGSLRELPGSVLLPVTYLRAFMSGSRRFRSWGAWL